MDDDDDLPSTQPAASSPAPIIEAGPPRPELFPMERYTLAMRRAALASGEPLPPATRLPTLRSLHFHLRSELADEELLATTLAWRNAYPETCTAIAYAVLDQLLSREEASRHALVERLVLDALGGGARGYYSIEATAERLAALDYEECCTLCAALAALAAAPPRRRVALRRARRSPAAPPAARRRALAPAARAARRDARRRARPTRRADGPPSARSDHFTAGSYGNRFHGYVLYRFLLYLRSQGVLPEPEAMETCSVCQHRAAAQVGEGGAPVMWRQAEPCRCATRHSRPGASRRLRLTTPRRPSRARRHWVCDPCFRELLAHGMGATCPVCREAVHTYGYGSGFAGMKE